MSAHLLALLPLIAGAAAAAIGGERAETIPRSVLLTSTAPTSDLPACLLNAYHGVYGDQHVFMPASDCDGPAFLETGSLAPLPTTGSVVWVGPAGVEGVATGAEAMTAAWDSILLASLTSPLKINEDGTQVAFSTAEEAAPSLLHSSETGMFISVPPHLLPVLDTVLPAHIVPVGVAPTPLGYDIPNHYAKQLANVTRSLRFNPKIASIVDTLSPDDVRHNVRWLTGEAPSGIVSRHSFTEGARVAAKWLKEKVEATGPNCTFFEYLPGFSPNVICTYPSTTNSTERVILSGHYDSRGSFGSTRAPGGNDDGSGTAHVLAVAQAIAEHNITFDKSVTLALFSGEEQGLWGSHYYAKHLSEQEATVILQIQADMIGYRVDGEPLQLALPATIELAEAGWLVSNISALYAPELVVGRTEACCSDHQSFVSYGFPATHVFERNGPIADPMYHNSDDFSNRDGYDFDQVVGIAKVTFATVLEVGGWGQKSI